MVTTCWGVIACVAVERLVELYVSARNAAWSRARGGLEFGQDHLWAMKVLHTGLLVGCVVETSLTGGRYWPNLTPLCAAAALGAQALRYWCITTLGRRWNIRVIVIPKAPPIVRGPYAYMAHPNYVAVVVEGAALPLAFGAWRVALVFGVLNAALLRRRIACEARAIAEVCGPYENLSNTPSERAA